MRRHLRAGAAREQVEIAPAHLGDEVRGQHAAHDHVTVGRIAGTCIGLVEGRKVDRAEACEILRTERDRYPVRGQRVERVSQNFPVTLLLILRAILSAVVTKARTKAVTTGLPLAYIAKTACFQA